MKVKDLIRLMNDHGTNPRIKLLKCSDPIYEGNPDYADNTMKQLTINSFTVIGRGQIDIYCK